MPNRDGTGSRTSRGSKVCTCPKCGHTEAHARGVSCTEKKCPKCNTPMRGEYCL